MSIKNFIGVVFVPVLAPALRAKNSHIVGYLRMLIAPLRSAVFWRSLLTFFFITIVIMDATTMISISPQGAMILLAVAGFGFSIYKYYRNERKSEIAIIKDNVASIDKNVDERLNVIDKKLTVVLQHLHITIPN